MLVAERQQDDGVAIVPTVPATESEPVLDDRRRPGTAHTVAEIDRANAGEIRRAAVTCLAATPRRDSHTGCSTVPFSSLLMLPEAGRKGVEAVAAAAAALEKPVGLLGIQKLVFDDEQDGAKQRHADHIGHGFRSPKRRIKPPGVG